jgi:hypothetical protein
MGEQSMNVRHGSGGAAVVEPPKGQPLPAPTRGVSVSHELEPHAWSNEDTAAFEAAIEAVNGAVGAYSALGAAEERKPNPDQAVIAAARAAQARLAQERERLRSTDRQQIAEARTRYAQLAGEVLAGIA